MSQNRIHITYQLSADDLIEASLARAHASPALHRAMTRRNWMVYVFILGYCAVVYALLHSAVVAVVVLISFLLAWDLFEARLTRAANRRFFHNAYGEQKLAPLLEPRTLTLTAEGIEIESPAYHQRIGWPAIADIHQDGQRMAFFVCGLDTEPVPARAFAGRAEFDAFLAEAQKLRLRAGRAVPAPDAPPPAPEAPPITYGLAPGDLAAGSLTLLGHSATWRSARRHGRAVIFGLALAVIVLGVLLGHAFNYLPSAALLAGLALAAPRLTNWLTWRQQRLLAAEHGGSAFYGQRRARLLPDGLAIAGPGFETHLGWHAITDLTRMEDRLVVLTSTQVGEVVPARAFADRAAFDGFCAELDTAWKLGRTAPLPTAPEPPAGPGALARWQPALAELIAARRAIMLGSRALRRFLWIEYGATVGLILLVALLPELGKPMGQLFFTFLFMLLVTAPVAALLSPLTRLREHLTIKRLFAAHPGSHKLMPQLLWRTEAGLGLATPATRAEIAWPALDGAIRAGDLLVLQWANRQWAAIPARAFADHAAFDAFANEAAQRAGTKG